LYVNDYLADTLHLSAEENGAYLLMMMHYWKKGSLGNDVERIANIARITKEKAQNILDEFFINDGEKYIHNRIDRELENANSRRESARENGKKGGRPKNPQITHRLIEGKPTDNPKGNPQKSSSPSPSPSYTSLQEEENNNDGKNKVFKKPTVQQISDYCKERKNTVNPEQFFDHYESKGWVVGKSKMKDWKSSVRTWERNNFQKEAKQDNFKGEVNFEF
jgi:uncharacterized protein YdaU (DUF1376 family)